jgi:hypothetical protein
MTITRIDVPTFAPRLGSTIAIRCRVHTCDGVVWAVVRPGPGGWTGDLACPIVSVDGNAMPPALADAEPEDVAQSIEAEVADAVITAAREEWWLE